MNSQKTAKKNAKKQAHDRNIAQNRKARHEFFIDDTYEAGLVLEGWEVKSLRAGQVSLAESYVIIDKNEAFLYGCHMTPLSTASTHYVANTRRTRKLLLHRRELDKLIGAVDRKGSTLVPLDLHWTAGRAKCTVGLARGKKQHDKRDDLKEKDWKREQQRTLKHSQR